MIMMIMKLANALRFPSRTAASRKTESDDDYNVRQAGSLYAAAHVIVMMKQRVK
jgi:hypothetical protein